MKAPNSVVSARNHSDVGNRRALGHRWHGADVKHDTCHGSAGFEDHFAEIVRDVTDLHSRLDIRPAFDERIENSGLFARQGHDLFDPDGMLDHCRRAG
jgi:hypothetical protein